MNRQTDATLCLDYMEYLSASCRKRASFFGLLVAGIAMLRAASQPACGSRRLLHELADKTISPQFSDEVNLSRLICLLSKKGFTAVDIQLPYTLSDEQLHQIRCELDRNVVLHAADERLCVRLLPLSAPQPAPHPHSKADYSRSV